MSDAALCEAMAMIDVPLYVIAAAEPVSAGNVRAMCAAVENASLLYWEPGVAEALSGTALAPASMLSVWARPALWNPAADEPPKALQLHYDLKALFGYPHAIVGDFESVFHTPVAIGDRIESCQILRGISEPKSTRLGRGRFWTIEVAYRKQGGEALGTDSFNCFAYDRGVS